MAEEQPEHGFVLISQAEADAVGCVEFQTTLRLTVDMQGEAVGGDGMVGQVAAVLFQRGVERLVVHEVSFVRHSAITDDDHRTAVFIVVIRACIAPCKSAAFACCRCFNGARGIAQLLIQPSIKLFSALQFALFRPCCPAVVLAYRA